MYLVEVIYHEDAPILTDQAVEEELNAWRLTEDAIRDGVDGGEECFDVFLIDGQLHEITKRLIALETKGLIRDFHIYEVDWVDIKSVAEKIL